MQPNETLQVGMVTTMVVVVIFGGIFALQGMNLQKQIAETEAYHQEMVDTDHNMHTSDVHHEKTAHMMEYKTHHAASATMHFHAMGKILLGIFVVLVGMLFAILMVPVRLAMMMKPMPAKPKRKIGKK